MPDQLDAREIAREIAKALADPFPAQLVQWLPKADSSTNGRRPCVPYLETATVIERLDRVLGVSGWQSKCHPSTEGTAVCELSILVSGSWIVRTEIGSAPAKKDAGQRLKAAMSDSLKRAAKLFGVGRYLSHVPRQWLDYDDQKRRVTSTAVLPTWALPGGSGTPPLLVDVAKSRKIAGALTVAFGGGDVMSYSLAHRAMTYSLGMGELTETDAATVRAARRTASERLKLNEGRPA